MRILSHILFVLSALSAAHASVTVYSQVPLGDATNTAAAAAASYTGAAAYDPTVLNPPPVPNPLPPMTFSIPLPATAAAVVTTPGLFLSIPQSGSFLGFSVEFSVITQVIGKNSTNLQVPFLNLMANIVQRAGRVNVRVGGNTQEFAVLVDSIADGKILEKDMTGLTNPTDTPPTIFTADVIYMLANVSALTDVNWYLGIPFNDTTNLRLGIAELGEAVLGNHLLGFQVGNEPDLYADHKHRPLTYGPYDYFGEFGVLVDALAADAQIPIRNNLIAPSVATGDWTPEMVWDTGFIPAYSASIGALAVEHYPTDNCYVMYGIGAPVDPQTVFPTYLNHTAGQALVQPYLNSSAIALAAGKPFLMFETNTASCGGFPGISDSFGSAMWGLDYGLQMAYSNFSGAMMHVGGQDDYYNPFTPPPTNQSAFHAWTVGPIYFSSLIIAEVFGSSNTSQIVDMAANGGNEFTPAYAIYENGVPARVALFNYITDPSGASTYTATISLPGTTPAQATVKYLSAASVSSKDNITWAGQTFGSNFASDGRLSGELNVQTITCDQTAQTCTVTVPAPSFALVFLSAAAAGSSDAQETSTLTFATTVTTAGSNTATIAKSVLETSNGMSGSTRQLGSTSKGSAALKSMAARQVHGGQAAAVAGVLAGAWAAATLAWALTR